MPSGAHALDLTHHPHLKLGASTYRDHVTLPFGVHLWHVGDEPLSLGQRSQVMRLQVVVDVDAGGAVAALVEAAATVTLPVSARAVTTTRRMMRD